MTQKQKQRVIEKIEKIKKTLAAEKRKFGCYDDSRGLRYLPPELYIKIGEYDNGLKYLKWFKKNFPDDVGLPDFLFASAIIYFKTGKIADAEEIALKTYFSNTYIFDKFFMREFKITDKKVWISYQAHTYLEHFNFRHDHEELLEFSYWLKEFTKSDKFIAVASEL